MSKVITRVAQTAKLVRASLKTAFPGIKFSVTSENFSMGNAINISYGAGPTVQDVDAVVRTFQDGEFDGMDDSYNRVKDRIGGARYVHVNRDIDAILLDGAEQMAKLLGVPFASYNTMDGHGEYLTNVVRRLTDGIDLTGKTRVVIVKTAVGGPVISTDGRGSTFTSGISKPASLSFFADRAIEKPVRRSLIRTTNRRRIGKMNAEGLTIRDLRAAAEAAKRFPAKQAGRWIAGEDWNDKRTAEEIRQRPKVAKKGCPCVAIAVARGEVSQDGLWDAFTDLHEAFKLEAKPFMMILGESPKALASILEGAADGMG